MDDLVPKAYFTAMTENRHDELAAMNHSMIAVTRSPWFANFLAAMPVLSRFLSFLFYCFVYDSYEHEIIYTVRAIAVFKFYSLRN